jgi:hypothetical protein
MDWVYILEDIKILEKRIDKKLDLLISQNPNPFPFEKLQKGKELRALCRAIQHLISANKADDAKYLLDILEEKGVKIGS